MARKNRGKGRQIAHGIGLVGLVASLALAAELPRDLRRDSPETRLEIERAIRMINRQVNDPVERVELKLKLYEQMKEGRQQDHDE